MDGRGRLSRNLALPGSTPAGAEQFDRGPDVADAKSGQADADHFNRSGAFLPISKTTNQPRDRLPIRPAGVLSWWWSVEVSWVPQTGRIGRRIGTQGPRFEKATQQRVKRPLRPQERHNNRASTPITGDSLIGRQLRPTYNPAPPAAGTGTPRALSHGPLAHLPRLAAPSPQSGSGPRRRASGYRAQLQSGL